MAQEYKIDHFLAVLSDKNFSLGDLKDNKENLEEALWYMDDERTRGGEVLDTLLTSPDITETKREHIIVNLTKLYPLSRNLVLRILKEVSFSDDAFLLGFDASNKMRKAIKDVLDKVKEQRGKLGSAALSYKKSIESLKEEVEDLTASQENVKAVKAEKDRLESEVRRLREETDEEKLNIEINKLKSELFSLEVKKKEQEDEKKKHSENIKHIKEELEKQQNSFEDEDVTRALRDLLRKFPKDEEDK